jgi:hypothetical protein
MQYRFALPEILFGVPATLSLILFTFQKMPE